jgi:hypothetical protein
MKKLVFWNGIYTALRPLYYLCKVFGVASYSYVADRRNKILTLSNFVTDSKYIFISFSIHQQNCGCGLGISYKKKKVFRDNRTYFGSGQ